MRTHVFEKGPTNHIVRASTAVPFLFHPVKIHGRYFYDGGAFDKMGLHKVSREQNILCHYLYTPSFSNTLEYRWEPAKKQSDRLKMITLQRSSEDRARFYAYPGPEIIEKAYEQTSRLLHASLDFA